MSSFERIAFHFQGAEELSLNAAVAKYLAASNIHFTSLDEFAPFAARIVRLPEIVVAVVQMPRSVVEWPRDSLSLGRGTLLISRNDSLSIECESPIWEAEPGPFFVPPGDTPLKFRVSEEIHDFVVISMNTAVFRGLQAPKHRPGLAPVQVSEELLAPLLAFLHELCNTTAVDPSQVGPLQSVAAEVTRTLVTLITGGESTSLSTYDYARQVIDLEYSKPHIVVADIAAAANVSERTLHAAFAEHGTTVVSELRAARVKAAAEIQATNPGITRQNLATAAGFGSVSSLLRALKDAEQST